MFLKNNVAEMYNISVYCKRIYAESCDGNHKYEDECVMRCPDCGRTKTIITHRNPRKNGVDYIKRRCQCGAVAYSFEIDAGAYNRLMTLAMQNHRRNEDTINGGKQEGNDE